MDKEKLFARNQRYRVVAQNGFRRHFWETIVIPTVLKRDNHECQHCSSKRKLDVAHSRYGLDITMRELITLCRSCHKKMDYSKQNWVKGA
jgi:hypothetical protein